MRLSVLLLVAVLLAAVLSSQASAETVEVEGRAAVKNGDVTAARDKAIDDARRKAVEQAVGAYIGADSFAKNFQLVHDKIIERAGGYITRYDIIGEGSSASGSEYWAKISAEVEKGRLTQDVDALHLLSALKEKPKVMIVMAEKFGSEGVHSPDGSELTQAESVMLESFRAKGFNVVDAATARKNITRDEELQNLIDDPKAASALAQQYEAQVAVVGNSVVTSSAGPGTTRMLPRHANVSAKVLRTDDAKVIASYSESAVKPHVDEATGGALAIREAAEKLSNYLSDRIIESWQQDVYGFQELTVIVSGLPSYDALLALKKYLAEKSPGGKDVQQYSWTDGTAKLGVDYEGKASELADAIKRERFPGFVLEPVDVSANTVTLKGIAR